MKRGWPLLIVLVAFSACNNSASVEKQADSLVKKIDTFSKKVLDSGKKDLKNLKENIQDQFGRKDSADK